MYVCTIEKIIKISTYTFYSCSNASGVEFCWNWKQMYKNTDV